MKLKRSWLIIAYYVTITLVLIFLITGFSGCSQVTPYLSECETMAEIHDIMRTVEYCYDWDSAEHAQLEYWQSPNETMELLTGDCDDYAILLMYLLNQAFGWEAEMALVKLEGHGFHHFVVYEGHIYDYVYQFQENEYLVEYTELHRYSYDYVMFVASVGGTRAISPGVSVLQ